MRRRTRSLLTLVLTTVDVPMPRTPGPGRWWPRDATSPGLDMAAARRRWFVDAVDQSLAACQAGAVWHTLIYMCVRSWLACRLCRCGDPDAADRDQVRSTHGLPPTARCDGRGLHEAPMGGNGACPRVWHRSAGRRDELCYRDGRRGQIPAASSLTTVAQRRTVVSSSASRLAMSMASTRCPPRATG